MRARIASIQVGLPRDLPSAGDEPPLNRPWSTGFHKSPVDGEIEVGPENLAGDGQADLHVHGGPNKAVCVYSAEHYPAWRARLELAEFPFGAFGENLTLEGATELSVCLGDLWQVGDVQFEVSQPREPCWKLARRWQLVKLPAWVVETGWTGWYFRVQRTGRIAAGQELTLITRPHPDWTIAAANDVMHRRRLDRDAALALASVPALSAEWREPLEKRAAKLD